MTPNSTALSRERIHEVLWDVAAVHADKDRAQLTPDCDLDHDLGLDSLDKVEVAMELEERLEFSEAEDFLGGQELTLGQVEQKLCERLLKG